MAKRNNQRRKVQDVRILDPLSGSDGEKLDRQLSSLQNQGDLLMCLCSEDNELTLSATAPLQGLIGWSQIRLFDDFTSLSGQFLTFRVLSVRFDVYDINPGVANAGMFSTFRDQYTSLTQPSFPFADVVDGPDSQHVPPGTGKISFSWMAHTTAEKGFYDVAPPSGTGSADFGGLRYYIPQNNTVTQKFRVVTKAIVQFRGRR